MLETVWRVLRLTEWMSLAKHNPSRTVAGWVCLIAALALYAPLAAASILVHGMACCTGDQCPIKQHHHPKKQSTQHADMNCEHETTGMTSCSMACCDDSEKPVVTPVAFLLPILPFAVDSGSLFERIALTKEIAISRSVAPLSPPPQINA